MAFEDFDVEIQDETGSIPEQFVDSVTTAGVVETITPTTGTFTSAMVVNPDKGPNANDKNDLLYVSFDGSTNYIVVKRGTSISISAFFSNIKIDSNEDGTNYEVVTTSGDN